MPLRWLPSWRVSARPGPKLESPEQLLDVSGVGPRILEWNADRIVVGPERAPD